MDEKHKGAIEKLKAVTDCIKNFQCLDPDAESLCKVKDMDLESYVKCLEEADSNCKFQQHFGSYYLCSCPVAVYRAKNLEPKSDLTEFEVYE